VSNAWSASLTRPLGPVLRAYRADELGVPPTPARLRDGAVQPGLGCRKSPDEGERDDVDAVVGVGLVRDEVLVEGPMPLGPLPDARLRREVPVLVQVREGDGDVAPDELEDVGAELEPERVAPVLPVPLRGP